MAKRNEFGTFGGVFTPCILTILGVIMFMRANFVVGHAGVLGAVGILALSVLITLLTALSTSAIGTNMRVRGGGAYFLVSRVLGPEHGGAVGVMLFLALSVSVPFYVLGFTEALVHTFPELQPHANSIALLTAGVLFAVTYVGAGWAIRVQYIVMAVLFGAIVVFLGGAFERFSTETFHQNLTAPSAETLGGQEPFPFWALFAIYFPAVTGILAGINMSGDLRDPGRSIPRGTLAAIAVGTAIYLLQIVLDAGAFTREELANRPFLLLKDHALYRAGALVTAGMFAASLSSALGSFMGAPRVLQAMGRDALLPVLKPFAKGSSRGDEPRRALLLSGVLVLAVLVWAGRAEGGQAFNLVAGIITEFFLCAYGMLNLAAFIEGVGRNPSFRPHFRFFHWSPALAGAIGCIAVAFIIDPAQAAASFTILGGLIWYVKRRELSSTFGDAWRGFVYRNLRNDLIRLSEMEETPKNWRPTCLVFTGNPDTRETLARLGGWFEADRGLVFLAQVLVGSYEDYQPRRQAALDRLRSFCHERDIQAFPVVLIDEDLVRGMAALMQTLQVGPIRPNLALFGWSAPPDAQPWPMPALMRLANAQDMAVCVIKQGARIQRDDPTRIDVWWRGIENGGLMLLLAHLLKENWEWRHAEIRLLRVVPNEAGRESTRRDLEELLNRARVDAIPKVLVAQRPIAEVIAAESAEADFAFLGVVLPEENEDADWYEEHVHLIPSGPTTALVCSAGTEDILA